MKIFELMILDLSKPVPFVPLLSSPVCQVWCHCNSQDLRMLLLCCRRMRAILAWLLSWQMMMMMSPVTWSEFHWSTGWQSWPGTGAGLCQHGHHTVSASYTAGMSHCKCHNNPRPETLRPKSIFLLNLFLIFWSNQGEYTGGQAKAWIYPSSLLQPITAKHIKQQPIKWSKFHLWWG